MIKNNQKYLNGLHVVIDALIIAGSYILAWWLKFKTPVGNVKPGVRPRRRADAHYRSQYHRCGGHDERAVCDLAAAFLPFHDRHVRGAEHYFYQPLPARPAGSSGGVQAQGIQHETCAARGILPGGGGIH